MGAQLVATAAAEEEEKEEAEEVAEAAAATANGALSTYQWRCGVRINNPRDYHRASSSRAPWCIHGVTRPFVRPSVRPYVCCVPDRNGLSTWLGHSERL